MGTLSRDIRTRALHEQPTPIGLDAAAMPGAQVLGDDGQVYTSMRLDGAAAYSWASAEDVARVLPLNSFDITISATGPDIVGERYQTINAALEYLSKFFIPYNAEWGTDTAPQVRLIIESGKTIAEQIFVRGLDFSFVAITAEDAEVTVDVSALTRQSSGRANEHAFIHATAGGVAPGIAGVIFVPSGTVPQDADVVAVSGAYTPRSAGLLVSGASRGSVTGRLTDFEGEPLATARFGGFKGWDFNLLANSGSDVFAANASFNDAAIEGVLVAGRFAAQGITATGCTDDGLRCRAGGRVTLSSTGAGDGEGLNGTWGQDFRKTPGSDSASDIVVDPGGLISTVSGVRGGYNLPFNLPLSEGTILLSGAPQLYDATGIEIADNAVATLTPPRGGGVLTITVASSTVWLPAFQGQIAYVTGIDPSAVKINGAGIGANLAAVTTDVTGTSGSDGNVTVSAQASTIKIENRAGGTRTFYLSWS